MPTKWLPIKHAPRNGVKFLAARRSAGSKGGEWIVRVCSFEFSKRKDRLALSGWFLGSGEYIEPTHYALFDMPS